MGKEDSIKAGLVIYKDFFDKEKSKELASLSLLVPAFQRKYAWDKKHVIELIESINQNEIGFYVGNILIQKSHNGSSGEDLIVDGQQRMITLSIILLVLKKAIKAKVINILFSKESGLPRIKFFRENLNKVYKGLLNEKIKIIRDGSIIKDYEDRDSANIKIVKNFDLIESEVNKIKNKADFLKKVLNLNIVVIKCPHNYDTNSLFEGLNSKGKSLTTVELAKNSLLGFSEKRNEDHEAVINVWEGVESMFEGKNANLLWFDKFLRQRSYIKYGYVGNKELFPKIRKTIGGCDSVLSFSKEVWEDAEYYIKLRNADLNNSDMPLMEHPAFLKAQMVLLAIQALGIDQIYSIILSLFKYGKIKKGYFKRDFFYKDLYRFFSFLVLFKYSKISPSKPEGLFAEFCREITPLSQKELADRIEGVFKKIKERSLIPPRDVFIKEFVGRARCTGGDDKKVTSNNNRSFLKTILLVVSNADISQTCYIEHIILKSKSWRIKYPDVVKEFDDGLRFNLGNLTLLKKDNLDDKIFADKIDEYHKSAFSITKELAKKKYSDGFNSKNPSNIIMKRGEILAGDLYDKLIGSI